ncbi:MAG: choice-of-anchor L domain-containing protein [Flammeovirgaceae bacterium]
MKKLAILLLFCCIANGSFAQEVQLRLKFLNTQLKPMKHTAVKLTEIETREEMKGKTDANGTVSFHIRSGKLWQIDFLKIKNYPMWRVKMPAKGVMNQKRTITYDVEKYKWELTPPIDRSKIDLKVVQSQANAQSKYEKKRALGRVILKRKSKAPLANFPVKLFSNKSHTLYEATTDAQGIAYFQLPLGELYDIELEGIERFSYLKIPPFTGNFYRTLTFEPMNFQETQSGNIISQALPSDITPTSARYLVTVNFKIKGKGPMANQVIHLKDDRDVTYQAKTTSAGVAKFMLPKGYTYYYVANTSGILEERIEVVDLKYVIGIGSMNRTVVIDPALTPRETSVKFALPKTPDAFNDLFGKNGLKVVDFRNNSVPYYAKSYLYFDDQDKAIGLKTGLLMTSGSVYKAIGPNDLPGASTQNSYYLVDNIPDDLLPKKDVSDKLSNSKDTHLGYGAYDLCRLEFDVMSQQKTLVFEYVFASEEYPEYLHFDDAFGIFVSKKGEDNPKNLAKVQGDNVSVSYVNPNSHAEWYWANDQKDKKSYQNWQYDGFTKKMRVEFPIEPHQTYTIKLIIFDRRDGIYDSGLFINFWAE